MSLHRRNPSRELDRVVAAMDRVRGEIVLLSEQLDPLRDEADGAYTRAIVTENTADEREARHSRGHADRLEESLQRSRRRFAELEARRDELIRALTPDHL